MSSYNELLNLIKKAANEANEASKPMQVSYGKVISTNPLKISIDQRLTLSNAQLVLTRNVSNYETEAQFESAERKKITIYNALKDGDNVILFRIQGGQKYVVVDKIGGSI